MKEKQNLDYGMVFDAIFPAARFPYFIFSKKARITDPNEDELIGLEGAFDLMDLTVQNIDYEYGKR
jgi:hypothetical protein